MSTFLRHIRLEYAVGSACRAGGAKRLSPKQLRYLPRQRFDLPLELRDASVPLGELSLGLRDPLVSPIGLRDPLRR